jgi:hypothetical protein
MKQIDIEPKGFDEIPEVRCFRCGNTEPDELFDLMDVE